MCGLITLFLKDAEPESNGNLNRYTEICEGMLETLRFRGPDEKNLLRMGPVFLGHTRLSIIDLNTGSQPILNEDQSVAVLLNGEIYNFMELRQDLEKKGHIFRSRTDTEVIVHLYEEYGENVFSRLNGMFAIVIYDSKRNILLAARDRMGEKPLLYRESSESFVLASELKAILRYPQTPTDIDEVSLALYFNCMYIPAPYSVFKAIRKLPPAHFLKIDNGRLSISKYWAPDVFVRWDMKQEEAAEEVLRLFSDSVSKRVVSDVPIGVFLSGGIDSSAVTAFMAQRCSRPIKTFSVGFADEIDERPFARMVADRYKTDHTEIFIEDRIEDVFEKVIGYFDEPFGDSSAIPTYLISREARKHVKVILTGDGGDELFAGYNSYLDQKYIWRGRISTKMFKTLNRLAITRTGRGMFEAFYPHCSSGRAYDHWLWVRTILTEHEIARFLPSSLPVKPSSFFRNSRWLNIESLDALSIAYSHDLNFYLPDDLLKKVDMASMLTSLECRAPFLDHRLIEFALTIPPLMKVKDDCLKSVLKYALSDYLPDAILHRPKTGFGAPVETWLRKQLKNLTFDLLQPGCKTESFISRQTIQDSLRNVNQGMNGDFRVCYKLWLILVLEVWARNYAQEYRRAA
jgi:asparagine synthase (glutamine-hydrolysing)